MSAARQRLRLQPLASRTGIGSLPHSEVDAALRVSFGHELPFLPQLPQLNPAELMLPAALEGLPGFGPGGTIDVDGWRRKRDPFGFAVEHAIAAAELAPFEPSAHACFQPFLRELQRRTVPFGKVQIAGPATARWYAKTSSGEPASEIAELDQQIFRLLLAKTLALVAAVRRTHATPILFLDEPGLIALDRQNPRHRVVLQELELMIRSLQTAGALVGIHCCGNTDWAALLGLGLDILSFDARLSLDAVVEETAAFRGFLASGAILALGIIPTEPGAAYAIAELVDSIEVSIRSTTPKIASVLAQTILTPACGLGSRTVADAEQITGELAVAQQRLQAVVATD